MSFSRRGIIGSVKRGATTYNFPSNAPLTPGATYSDVNNQSLMLGVVFHSTVDGVSATGVRFWAPMPAVGKKFRGYLFAGSSGSTILALNATSQILVFGWNVSLFDTPYSLVNGTDVTAAAFLTPADGDGSNTVSYTALGAGMGAVQTVPPVQSVDTASRYNYGGPTAPDIAISGGDDAGSSSNWYGVDVVVVK